MSHSGYIFSARTRPDPTYPALLNNAALPGFELRTRFAELGAVTSLSKLIKRFESALNAAIFTNPADGLCGVLMETDTFIDAPWLLEWTKQVDGYVFSTYFHKDRTGRLRAGPDLGLPTFRASTRITRPKRAIPDGMALRHSRARYGYGDNCGIHVCPGIRGIRLRHFDAVLELRRGLARQPAITGTSTVTLRTLLMAREHCTMGWRRSPASGNAVMRALPVVPATSIVRLPNARSYATVPPDKSNLNYNENWLNPTPVPGLTTRILSGP